MKFKTLFQVLTLLTLVFSAFGASGQVQAAPAAEAVVVSRAMTVWNATYSGSVSASRYEQWTFSLTETTSFIVSAALVSGDLIPLLTLSGDGISGSGIPGEGVVSATLPPGNYSILIQPKSGSGSYNFTIRVAGLAGTIVFDPTQVAMGNTFLVTVGLNNVPAEGLTSAEFDCTYDPAFLEVSDLAGKELFGADPATAPNGPAGGKFIFAVAGSAGKKATTSGAVFTFNAKALKTGQTSITCAIRVSKGDKTLTAIDAVTVPVTIPEPEGTLQGKVVATKLVKVCAYDSASVEKCADAAADGTFSMKLKPGVYDTVIASADGFLQAKGSATVTAGTTTTMPAVALLAGDIDGNAVIDQFDAMSIGMNYNSATPAKADLNNDGVINVLDLEALAANYRKTGPTVWQ